MAQAAAVDVPTLYDDDLDPRYRVAVSAVRADGGLVIVARIVRTFEEETPSGSTRQMAAKALELVTVPGRGDRVALPDRPDDAVPVDRSVLVASEPGAWQPGAKAPRVVVHLAPEPVEGLDAALAAGWRETNAP